MLAPLLACVLLADDARAQSQANASPVGTVTHLSGVLTARHPDGSSRVLGVKSEIAEGDTLVTEQDSYARIKFVDNAEVVLRPTSQLQVSSYVYDADHPEHDRVELNLIGGGLRAVTGLLGKRNHDAIRFGTPGGEIQVRGTHFGALFCQNDCGGVPTPSGSTPANGLHVDVTAGAIVLSNKGGSQVYQAGQFGYVMNPNIPPVVLPPSQGVQVTMPSSISRNAPSPVGTSASAAAQCVVQ